MCQAFFCFHTSKGWYVMKRSEFFEKLDKAAEACRKKVDEGDVTLARSLEAVRGCAVAVGLLRPEQEVTEKNPILKLIRFLEGPDSSRGCISRTEYRLNEAAWDYYREQARLARSAGPRKSQLTAGVSPS